jgi:hypothetical protein
LSSTSLVLLFEFIFDLFIIYSRFPRSPSFLDVLASDHRLPPDPSSTLYPSPTPAAHAAYARLLSRFLDAPAASFGVHRMALAGKAAGKNVGMCFGPGAAASAIR